MVLVVTDPFTVEDMKSWLDVANIDLKSWDNVYYKKALKGGLEALKNTLRRMVKTGICVEVTILIILGEIKSLLGGGCNTLFTHSWFDRCHGFKICFYICRCLRVIFISAFS